MSEDIGWYHPVDESDQWDGFVDSGMEHFRGRPIMNLAREAIQNSFDAVESKPVEVKINLHKVLTSTVPGYNVLKDNIDLCNNAAKEESKKAEIFFDQAQKELQKKEIKVLEISDYNTTGIIGPCENGTEYYAFMKAKGQSRKESETASGSYGIGKLAPYTVSLSRTIFVSTIYKKDNEYHQLTQGKSILMSHDRNGQRKQGVGFWGIKDKCQPIKGISSDLPHWVQRANSKNDLKCKGTKLTVLCFETSNQWQELLAVSVAENFFGAIYENMLRIKIENKYDLTKDSILEFFGRSDIRDRIKNLQDEPDKFDSCRHYLTTLQDDNEIIEEESEMRDLGLVKIRIKIGEGLPKKVCILRNGMFITDRLNGLKSFTDYKDFVALVQCQSTKGNELLRAMEPPRHDDFEPDRLPTKDLQRKGNKALKDLAKWVRQLLKKYAREPVSEITEIDELKDFFGDEGDEGTGKGIEEINPSGEVIIRARPLKLKAGGAKKLNEKLEDGGGQEEDGDSGNGAGDLGRKRGASGGRGSGRDNKHAQKNIIEIRNVRSVHINKQTRKIAFTPKYTGKIILGLLEAGADTDYAISIIRSNKGQVKKGRVMLDVKTGQRINLEVILNKVNAGAIKVVAYEI